MKIAYLILCHKEPEQVAALIKRLSTDDAVIIVHVDARAGTMQDNLSVLVKDQQNVWFAERHSCYWGQFGIVLASISCVREALKHQFDYAFLISGQDYPLQSSQYIKAFLSKNIGQQFIESFSLDKPNRWSAHTGKFNPTYRVCGLTIPIRSHMITTPFMRKFPLNMEPHAGTQWWCLSREALQYVSTFVDKYRSFVRFFRFTVVPDELFFQSILSNSEFKSALEPPLTYADWNPKSGPIPKTLDEDDYDSLRNSGLIFARKFDRNKSQGLISMLDREEVTA